MSQLTAEIVTFGNELLIGRTVDTNSTYLAYHLTLIGFKITRITTLPDEKESGVKGLLEVFKRTPNVLCISGGLGPTHDDIQLNILSEALGRPLIEHPDVIKKFVARYGTIPESIRKMALLPKDSKPLKNSQGSAPGVLSEYNSTFIFSLPGVPREMKAIFQDEILPFLNSRFEQKNKMVEFGFDAFGAYESGIVNLTKKLMKEFPNLGFKSHPKKDGDKYYLSLHVYAITDQVESVKNAAIQWKEAIKHYFGDKVNITEINPVFTEEFEAENETLP